MHLVIDEVVRYNVPFDAKLVVIDSQDVRIDLEGRRSSTLPAPPARADAAELARYVDGLVGEDGLYILIPDGARRPLPAGHSKTSWDGAAGRWPPRGRARSSPSAEYLRR